jgi:hypothetical protein
MEIGTRLAILQLGGVKRGITRVTLAITPSKVANSIAVPIGNASGNHGRGMAEVKAM